MANKGTFLSVKYFTMAIKADVGEPLQAKNQFMMDTKSSYIPC